MFRSFFHARHIIMPCFCADDKIGKCKIELDKLHLGPQPKKVERVVDANWFTRDAKIHLLISYA
jgi:hypothetical protein